MPPRPTPPCPISPDDQFRMQIFPAALTKTNSCGNNLFVGQSTINPAGRSRAKALPQAKRVQGEPRPVPSSLDGP